MKKIKLLLFLLITATAMYAQQGNVQVQGQLVDSIANESVPYATIKILDKANGKYIKGVVADDKGKFSFPIARNKEYMLSVEYTGRITVQKELTFNSESTLDLGKINFESDEKKLSEVVVEAQKVLVKVDLDKITYNMQDDPESETNDLLEMFKKVPMVTVDGEENIQLNGSSNFKIYMNGKPSTMIASSPKDVLKSMPANTVKDIEVITDPGAKYDAEGTAGIINIITKKNTTMAGYTANIRTNVDNRGGYGGGGYGTLKYGKFGFTGNFNYYDHKQGRSYNSSERQNFDHSTEAFVRQNGYGKGNFTGMFGAGEISYEIDTLNLVNVSMNQYGGDSKNNAFSNTWASDNLENTLYEYENKGHSKSEWGNTSINADYQHTFAKNKDRLFTLSYRLNISPNDSENFNTLKDLEKGSIPSYITLGQVKQHTDADTKEHNVQGDFVSPIAKIHTLETGFKYTRRINKSNSNNEQNNATTGGWVPNPNVDNDGNKFKHNSDIFSAYAGYNLRLKKWGFKTGLRYEFTNQEIRYDLKPENNFKTDFGNFVPSATLTYQIKPAQTIRVGYNMRISRPGIRQLNPYKNTSNPISVTYGNPDLDPEKSHSINSNYSFFNPKFNVNVNLSYNFTDNGIERLSFKNATNPDIEESSYFNIGKTKRTNLSLYVNWSPNPKFRWTANMYGSYTDLKTNNDKNTSNSGFSGNVFTNLQYNMPWKIWLGGGVSVSSPYISLQSKSSSFFHHRFNVRRSFLAKDKLTVSAFANSPFIKNRTWKNRTETENYIARNENVYETRSFGMSVSFRFGELKAQIKKARRGISETDVMSGGGEGQGGGEGGGQ